jgi:Tol biopolymer transport system component
MRWIVFQATPRGESAYQMYVAPLRYRVGEGWPGEFSSPPLKVKRAKLSVPMEIEGIDSAICITPAGSKNTCGYFSPDGFSLIFASTGAQPTPSTRPATSAPGYQRSSGTYRWEFPPEMEIFRADGWEGMVTAAKPQAGTNLAQHPLTRNDAYDAEGSYSSDGQWIVFTSNRTGDNELFAMRPDGTDVVQLTHTPGYDGGPFFSPDNKRLVYRSDRAGNDLLQIFVADIVREHSHSPPMLARERQLTRGESVNWGPYWHPDGKHIIYATSVHGHQNYELYLMRADGSRKTRITFTDGFDGLPVFSPDGRFLMWSSKRTRDGTTQVFVAKFKMPRGS